MPKRKSAIFRKVLPPIAAIAMISVAEAASLADSGLGDFSHLSTEPITLVILSSIALFLLSVLIRLRQLHRGIKRKSMALEKSERHLQLMADNLPQITIFQLVCESDGTFRFNYLSKGNDWGLGFDRDQLLADAHLIFKQIHESDIPLLQESFLQGRTKLAPANIEIRVQDLSGKLKWLHINAVPNQEADSLVWNGFMQDVSAVKCTEDALAEETRNFQNLFNTIDDFLLVWDMNGKLLHANPSVEQRLEYTFSELLNMTIFDLYQKNSQDEISKITASIQSDKATTCGLPLQMKNGITIPVKTNIFLGSWENKTAIFGVARDIASLQQTENALRESQQMLQLIMDTIPMAVFWKDKDSIYQGGNKTFIHECGLENLSNLIGKTPYDLFDPSLAPDIIKRDQQVITNNQPFFNLLQSHTLLDGSSGWREISKIPLHDADGRAVGVLGVWNNITERKRAEERLKRTLEDMERFNQLMRGRERRTLELKAEINTLLKEVGKPIKYRTTMDMQE